MECPSCHQPIEGSPQFCPSCGASTAPIAKAGTLNVPTTEVEPRFDPFIGQVVGGRYKITKLLGEGGMGAVYVGEQNIGGTVRKVAIKTLHAHISKDPKVLQRFERECATVAELSHPNTIQIYDFGKTDDGILYMVMEFVQGESLASALEKQGAIEPPRTQHIIQQICDALGEAHRLGIIHRDLKPENIVLTQSAKDWVKVLDFGIAKRGEDEDKAEKRLTQQGTVLGTPPYMSPEQFTGKALTPGSDIYSIAVIAYEMLSGRLPFAAATPWEWASKHMTAEPMPLSVTPTGMPIPEPTVRAVMRALAKAPEDRFASTKEFFDALAVPLPGYEGLAVSGGYAAAPMSMVASSGFSVGPPLVIGGAAPPGGTAPIAVPGYVASPGMLTPLPSNTPSSVVSVGQGLVEPTGKTQSGGSVPPTYASGQASPSLGVAAVPVAPFDPSAPRRGRSSGTPIIAAVAAVGLLAIGGIVFAVTRPPKHLSHRGGPAASDTPRSQDNGEVDAGGRSATNERHEKEHMPPLLDTALPSLPINVARTTDAGPVAPATSEPHACKSARSWKAKLDSMPKPDRHTLESFNKERSRCIEGGGHL